MDNTPYMVNVSPHTDTIDVIVSKPPSINGKNELDPKLGETIVDAYRKNIYEPQIKQYGQIYSYPTINIHPKDNSELTLEENLDELWRDWIHNEIKSIKTEKTNYEKDSVLKTAEVVGMIATLSSLVYALNERTLTSTLAFTGAAVFTIGIYFLKKYRPSKVKNNLLMYEALLNTNLRTCI